MNTLHISITGITCDACIKLIKKKVGKINGVKDIVININNGNTIITSIKEIHVTDITSALSGLPYQIKGV